MKNAAKLLAAALLAAALPAGAQAQSDTYYAGVVQHPATNIPPTQVVARYLLPTAPGINDFSGIASLDGVNVTLLSDHGFIVTGRLVRGYGQQIEGFQMQQRVPLLSEEGTILSGSLHDSEGLALDRSGRIYVSFEQHNRVLRYARLGARAEALGEHADFSRMRAGRGMEALAVAHDGTIYAIPERPARATYGFPSYRLQNGEWTGSFRLPQDGTFLPVGADFGPDGLLYVLEREQGTRGFRSQVRRFGIRGRGISEPQVIMRSEYGQFDNLEGLSVFRDWSGRIRLLMVSDDDRAAGRRSEIVDVVVNR
jgi:hypothetical protein